MSCCVTVSMCVHVIYVTWQEGYYVICMHKPKGTQRLRASACIHINFSGDTLFFVQLLHVQLTVQRTFKTTPIKPPFMYLGVPWYKGVLVICHGEIWYDAYTKVWVIRVNRVKFCLGQTGLIQFIKYPGLSSIQHQITCFNNGIWCMNLSMYNSDNGSILSSDSLEVI